MGPWWEGLGYQSEASFRRRHPRASEVLFQAFDEFHPLLIIFEMILWSMYAIMSWSERHIVLSISSIIFLVLAFLSIPYLRRFGRQKPVVVGLLLHQLLFLALETYFLITEAVAVFRLNEDDMPFGVVLALTILTLIGVIWSSYLYWKIFVAKASTREFDDGDGDVVSFRHYTDEEPYLDENGPLAIHYEHLHLRPRPEIIEENEVIASVTDSCTNGIAPYPKRTEPQPANGAGTLIAPGVGSGAVEVTPRLLMPTRVWSNYVFRLIVAMTVVVLILEGLAIWITVLTVHTHASLHWINITQLILPLSTVPLAASSFKWRQNPSSRIWGHMYDISFIVSSLCLISNLFLGLFAGTNCEPGLEEEQPLWCHLETGFMVLWVLYLTLHPPLLLLMAIVSSIDDKI
ncbi:hypothetical protein NM208_g13728 [Fusarium decemcellulare]|uniref:Uncharacterized protein n=1 Tax=Fusarium decemcellulare TaxID=57161 RepID=A0ACC1RMX9_9HYPO|nr:hypothetical protein NM208_g13728 [Fusarium decemcellulare]